MNRIVRDSLSLASVCAFVTMLWTAVGVLG